MKKDENGQEKHNALVAKFNLAVDAVSSFAKGIFPFTVRLVVGLKDIFYKRIFIWVRE